MWLDDKVDATVGNRSSVEELSIDLSQEEMNDHSLLLNGSFASRKKKGK